MIFKKIDAGQEQRKYIRLGSVFPVQFRILNAEGKRFLSEWLQGFTNNISKGGICLSINQLNPETAKLIKAGETILSLDMEIPITKGPVSALAKVIWVKDALDEPNKYVLGLIYTDIDRGENRRIMLYARARKMFVPAVMAIIFVLGLGLGLDAYINYRLIQGNRVLITRLVKVMQESSSARQSIRKIDEEREYLLVNINSLQAQTQGLHHELQESQAEAGKVQELRTAIARLNQAKTGLEQQLVTLQHKKDSVSEKLSLLDRKKSVLEKASLDKMYHWLKVHQNPRTGLIMSFEGDNDIADWAFIYDQALALQAYTLFSDFDRAKKILDFFDKKAKTVDGKFVNAYYCSDGSPAEYVVHSGPNIWIGIAALQYMKKTNDKTYLGLAERIAQAMIYLQKQDADGGLKGGPNVEWYSTEHNLDAYAFFNMLYQVTSNRQYKEAEDKILNWLLLHTYDKANIPIMRGKGDSTIATDTYAWSIASIGPLKLQELNMDPEKIVQFAEDNCVVEVSYIQPGGRAVKIKGFDFAPQRHIARGGVVSSEWTAQMVIAFKLMADFYGKKGMSEKAASYAQKADEYLAQLAKMIVSSPSPSGQGDSCLPYSTEEMVDTGHGWMTPKGKTTGSIAGTAYTLFAYYNYNPLELEN